MAKKKSIKISELAPDVLCSMIDGDYDAANNTCDIPLDDSFKANSIFEHEEILGFFILQVIGGAIGSVLNTYYMFTTLPSIWWTSYIILAITYIVALSLHWFKTRNLKESFYRVTISLLMIGAMTFVIGSIYYWDITTFLSFESFAGYPVASMMSGIIISALLSIILLHPSNKK